jgi:hypothetical protein
MLTPPSIGQAIDFDSRIHGIVKDIRATQALIVFGDGSVGWHSIHNMYAHIPKTI